MSMDFWAGAGVGLLVGLLFALGNVLVRSRRRP
jgi:hypothetical protein